MDPRRKTLTKVLVFEDDSLIAKYEPICYQSDLINQFSPDEKCRDITRIIPFEDTTKRKPTYPMHSRKQRLKEQDNKYLCLKLDDIEPILIKDPLTQEYISIFYKNPNSQFSRIVCCCFQKLNLTEKGSKSCSTSWKSPKSAPTQRKKHNKLQKYLKSPQCLLNFLHEKLKTKEDETSQIWLNAVFMEKQTKTLVPYFITDATDIINFTEILQYYHSDIDNDKYEFIRNEVARKSLRVGNIQAILTVHAKKVNFLFYANRQLMRGLKRKNLLHKVVEINQKLFVSAATLNLRLKNLKIVTHANQLSGSYADEQQFCGNCLKLVPFHPKSNKAQVGSNGSNFVEFLLNKFENNLKSICRNNCKLKTPIEHTINNIYNHLLQLQLSSIDEGNKLYTYYELLRNSGAEKIDYSSLVGLEKQALSTAFQINNELKSMNNNLKAIVDKSTNYCESIEKEMRTIQYDKCLIHVSNDIQCINEFDQQKDEKSTSVVNMYYKFEQTQTTASSILQHCKSTIVDIQNQIGTTQTGVSLQKIVLKDLTAMKSINSISIKNLSSQVSPYFANATVSDRPSKQLILWKKSGPFYDNSHLSVSTSPMSLWTSQMQISPARSAQTSPIGSEVLLCTVKSAQTSTITLDYFPRPKTPENIDVTVAGFHKEKVLSQIQNTLRLVTEKFEKNSMIIKEVTDNSIRRQVKKIPIQSVGPAGIWREMKKRSAEALRPQYATIQAAINPPSPKVKSKELVLNETRQEIRNNLNRSLGLLDKLTDITKRLKNKSLHTRKPQMRCLAPPNFSKDSLLPCKNFVSINKVNVSSNAIRITTSPKHSINKLIPVVASGQFMRMEKKKRKSVTRKVSPPKVGAPVIKTSYELPKAHKVYRPELKILPTNSRLVNLTMDDLTPFQSEYPRRDHLQQIADSTLNKLMNSSKSENLKSQWALLHNKASKKSIGPRKKRSIESDVMSKSTSTNTLASNTEASKHFLLQPVRMARGRSTSRGPVLGRRRSIHEWLSSSKRSKSTNSPNTQHTETSSLTFPNNRIPSSQLDIQPLTKESPNISMNDVSNYDSPTSSIRSLRVPLKIKVRDTNVPLKAKITKFVKKIFNEPIKVKTEKPPKHHRSEHSKQPKVEKPPKHMHEHSKTKIEKPSKHTHEHSKSKIEKPPKQTHEHSKSKIEIHTKHEPLKQKPEIHKTQKPKHKEIQDEPLKPKIEIVEPLKPDLVEPIIKPSTTKVLDKKPSITDGVQPLKIFRKIKAIKSMFNTKKSLEMYLLNTQRLINPNYIHTPKPSTPPSKVSIVAPPPVIKTEPIDYELFKYNKTQNLALLNSIKPLDRQLMLKGDKTAVKSSGLADASNWPCFNNATENLIASIKNTEKVLQKIIETTTGIEPAIVCSNTSCTSCSSKNVGSKFDWAAKFGNKPDKEDSKKSDNKNSNFDFKQYIDNPTFKRNANYTICPVNVIQNNVNPQYTRQHNPRDTVPKNVTFLTTGNLKGNQPLINSWTQEQFTTAKFPVLPKSLDFANRVSKPTSKTVSRKSSESSKMSTLPHLPQLDFANKKKKAPVAVEKLAPKPILKSGRKGQPVKITHAPLTQTPPKPIGNKVSVVRKQCTKSPRVVTGQKFTPQTWSKTTPMASKRTLNKFGRPTRVIYTPNDAVFNSKYNKRISMSSIKSNSAKVDATSADMKQYILLIEQRFLKIFSMPERQKRIAYAELEKEIKHMLTILDNEEDRNELKRLKIIESVGRLSNSSSSVESPKYKKQIEVPTPNKLVVVKLEGNSSDLLDQDMIKKKVCLQAQPTLPSSFIDDLKYILSRSKLSKTSDNQIKPYAKTSPIGQTESQNKVQFAEQSTSLESDTFITISDDDFSSPTGNDSSYTDFSCEDELFIDASYVDYYKFESYSTYVQHLPSKQFNIETYDRIIQETPEKYNSKLEIHKCYSNTFHSTLHKPDVEILEATKNVDSFSTQSNCSFSNLMKSFEQGDNAMHVFHKYDAKTSPEILEFLDVLTSLSVEMVPLKNLKYFSVTEYYSFAYQETETYCLIEQFEKVYRIFKNIRSDLSKQSQALKRMVKRNYKNYPRLVSLPDAPRYESLTQQFFNNYHTVTLEDCYIRVDAPLETIQQFAPRLSRNRDVNLDNLSLDYDDGEFQDAASTIIEKKIVDITHNQIISRVEKKKIDLSPYDCHEYMLVFLYITIFTFIFFCHTLNYQCE